MDEKIWLSSPHMGGFEQNYINEAFESNWIAPMGPNVIEFERDLELYLKNNSYVTALSSGTAAIHLALVMLGIKTGDEVLCQTKTFVASVNPVVYLGATPILVDSETKTWNMCPEMLEKAIKERIHKGIKPKAIIAINIYGMPYNVDAIHSLANEYGIAVIEDSAEALGSQYFGQPCGTFGDFSILSFNGNKIITTSGGGALVSRHSNDKDKALYLATQAKDPGMDYSHSQLGFNYRMSNISASIGRGQMHVLGDRIESRRNVFKYYYSKLKHINQLEFLLEPEGYFSNRWLTCILTDSESSKNDILNLFAKHNIDARPSWKPMHLQALYEKCPSYLNGVSDDLYKRGICLPSGSNLSEEQLDKVINVLTGYYNV